MIKKSTKTRKIAMGLALSYACYSATNTYVHASCGCSNSAEAKTAVTSSFSLNNGVSIDFSGSALSSSFIKYSESSVEALPSNKAGMFNEGVIKMVIEKSISEKTKEKIGTSIKLGLGGESVVAKEAFIYFNMGCFGTLKIGSMSGVIADAHGTVNDLLKGSGGFLGKYDKFSKYEGLYGTTNPIKFETGDLFYNRLTPYGDMAFGSANKIAYVSPEFRGFSVHLSYAPSSVAVKEAKDFKDGKNGFNDVYEAVLKMDKSFGDFKLSGFAGFEKGKADGDRKVTIKDENTYNAIKAGINAKSEIKQKPIFSDTGSGDQKYSLSYQINDLFAYYGGFTIGYKDSSIGFIGGNLGDSATIKIGKEFKSIYYGVTAKTKIPQILGDNFTISGGYMKSFTSGGGLKSKNLIEKIVAKIDSFGPIFKSAVKEEKGFFGANEFSAYSIGINYDYSKVTSFYADFIGFGGNMADKEDSKSKNSDFVIVTGVKVRF